MDLRRLKGLIVYKVYKPFLRIKYLFPNLFLGVFPLKNTIVLESNPDLTCNTNELFQYMQKDNFFSSFQFVWLVDSPERFTNSDQVKYESIKPTTWTRKIRKYYICNRSKILIDCNRHYRRYKTSKRQLNIYLDHGMPLKNMTNQYGFPLDYCFDYIVSQAEFFNKYLVTQYNMDANQIYVAGVPRNDQFFHKVKSLSDLYPDINNFDKIIAWVPTFRQIKDNGRVDCISNQPLGMPILYSEEDIITLEKYLEKQKALVVIKPHPVQDLSVLKNLKCKNIRILYNDEMLSRGIQTNEFLNNCDAMITDYSGIYYDYLLTDRPIAITLDDYEEYKSQKGFVFEDPLEILKGYYIYTLSDMENFISSVCDGKDEFYEERLRIKHLTNDFIDGNSSKRVCDFIKSKYDEIWDNQDCR